MIVVDTNIVAYLYLSTPYSEQAEHLLLKDPQWIAPVLWRRELRNVLALYLRKRLLTLEQASDRQTEAQALPTGREFDLPSVKVSQLVAASDSLEAER